MSDLMNNLGTVFDTTANTAADSGFLADAASALDSGSAAATPDLTAAAPPAEPDTSAVQQPPAPPPDPTLQGQQQPPPSAGVGDAGAFDQNGSQGVFDTHGTALTGPAAATWFQNLSPGAQAILAGTAKGGAAGLLAALAQKTEMEHQQRIIDQRRTDKMRRSEISAMPSGGFQPKGLIDSARTGG